MTAIVFNVVFFTLFFIYLLIKRKGIDSSVVLLFLYLVVSICGIFYYLGLSSVKTSVVYSVYFCLICTLYFYPIISKRSLTCKGVEVKRTNGLIWIVQVYTFLSLVVIYDLIQMLTIMLANGNWATMKADAYNGDIVYNSSLFLIFARFYVDYFRLVIVLYAFYLLTQKGSSFYYCIFLLIIGILPNLLTCLVYVYRGGLLVLTLSVLCSFLLFKKQLPQLVKKRIYFFFSICAILFSILIIGITLSRFDTHSSDSIVDYLGQSMVEYNYGIAVPIHSYANGKYFFSSLLNLRIEQICIDSLYGISTSNGGALDTFVGCLVLDFGFILGLAIALFFFILLRFIFCKRKCDFADAYLYMFYLEFLILGVFHATTGFALNCILTLLVYAVLKTLNRNIKTNYKIKRFKTCLQ
ncbi:hypothetical protein [Bacteroides cutis]|uniref:hypothetical protein n=1 Tax=Bacteroides cutis TaxID=2024197 RepID=UPI000C78D612|nr:hypothetical protein [Bacteroides cutis]